MAKMSLNTECLALKSTSGEISIEHLYLFSRNTLKKVIYFSGNKSEFLTNNYDDLYYIADDLTPNERAYYNHIFITLGEIQEHKKNKKPKNSVYDNNKTRTLINMETILLPCSSVPNILYYPFFTIEDRNLRAINFYKYFQELISERNLYYLFSDLSKEEQAIYQGLAITFADALKENCLKMTR